MSHTCDSPPSTAARMRRDDGCAGRGFGGGGGDEMMMMMREGEGMSLGAAGVLVSGTREENKSAC